MRRAVEHYERAQDLLGGALEKQDASALLRLGRAYELIGMADKAAQASERLLTCAHEAKDATLETHALSRMAPLAFQSLDGARADELMTQLRASAQATGDPALQAQAEWTLAQIHFYAQRSAVALGHAERDSFHYLRALAILTRWRGDTAHPARICKRRCK